MRTRGHLRRRPACSDQGRLPRSPSHPVLIWHVLWPQPPLSKSRCRAEERGAKLGAGGQCWAAMLGEGGDAEGKATALHIRNPGPGFALHTSPVENCLSRASGTSSAYRLDAELADGVVHQHRAVLHAHPDVSVGPAALVRPVLAAFLLHGATGQKGGQWAPLIAPSPSPTVTTVRSHTRQVPTKQCSGLGESSDKCLPVSGETEATATSGRPCASNWAFLVLMPGHRTPSAVTEPAGLLHPLAEPAPCGPGT